jgi:hypothetical protein
MNKIHTAFHAIALASAVLLALAGNANAQTTADAGKAAAKPVKKAVKKLPPVMQSASRTSLKSAAKNVAAGIEAAEAALTPDELAIAERVYVGLLPCELGASVTLTADPKAPGYFDMQGKNFKYRMFPVPTTTNTVRLEDRKGGAVWLQMGNKSMLMSQKLGTRLADECMSPAQLAMAEAIKLNPPVSVLDTPKPAASAAVAKTPAAAGTAAAE